MYKTPIFFFYSMCENIWHAYKKNTSGRMTRYENRLQNIVRSLKKKVSVLIFGVSILCILKVLRCTCVWVYREIAALPQCSLDTRWTTKTHLIFFNLNWYANAVKTNLFFIVWMWLFSHTHFDHVKGFPGPPHVRDGHGRSHFVTQRCDLTWNIQYDALEMMALLLPVTAVWNSW